MAIATVPRILVVDDHASVRRGLQEILRETVGALEFGHASGRMDALELVRGGKWDLAIIDLNLQGHHGLDVIRLLRDEQPGLHVLVYSVHAEEQFGLRAIRAGADGYLTKDRPAEEIAKAVRAILGGGQYISLELAELMVEAVKGGSRTRLEALSNREHQVLRLLSSGKSPTQIGAELNLSAKTITTYRARILEKLRLKTNADLVRYALENHLLD